MVQEPLVGKLQLFLLGHVCPPFSGTMLRCQQGRNYRQTDQERQKLQPATVRQCCHRRLIGSSKQQNAVLQLSIVFLRRGLFEEAPCRGRVSRTTCGCRPLLLVQEYSTRITSHTTTRRDLFTGCPEILQEERLRGQPFQPRTALKPGIPLTNPAPWIPLTTRAVCCSAAGNLWHNHEPAPHPPRNGRDSGWSAVSPSVTVSCRLSPLVHSGACVPDLATSTFLGSRLYLVSTYLVWVLYL